MPLRVNTASIEFERSTFADAALAQRAVSIGTAISSWQSWCDNHLEATLSLDDAELERRPELIAWLFPTGGRSHAAPNAPVIGRRELRALAESDPAIQHVLRRSFARVARMLGLVTAEGRLQWAGEAQAWAQTVRRDSRVYRMLRCLHVAGLEEAQPLMRFLVAELGGDPARAEALSWFRHQVATR